jgi:hypothetical protein
MIDRNDCGSLIMVSWYLSFGRPRGQVYSTFDEGKGHLCPDGGEISKLTNENYSPTSWLTNGNDLLLKLIIIAPGDQPIGMIYS